MPSRTLVKVKPDAYKAGNVGNIIAVFEKNGFQIKGLKVIHLTKQKAEQFYAIHKERPFFGELVEFMTSGPVVPIVLEWSGSDAVSKAREVIGATDPKEAAPGTVRKLYAKDKGENAIHGSDSDENAATEIAFYFQSSELL